MSLINKIKAQNFAFKKELIQSQISGWKMFVSNGNVKDAHVNNDGHFSKDVHWQTLQISRS